MLRRPKAKNITSGEALTRASTKPLLRPEGAIAGARAMKTSTLSLRSGCIASAAKACAVP